MKAKYDKENIMAVKYGWTEEDFEWIQAQLYGVKSANNIPATPSEMKGYQFYTYNHRTKDEPTEWQVDLKNKSFNFILPNGKYGSRKLSDEEVKALEEILKCQEEV